MLWLLMPLSGCAIAQDTNEKNLIETGNVVRKIGEIEQKIGAPWNKLFTEVQDAYEIFEYIQPIKRADIVSQALKDNKAYLFDLLATTNRINKYVEILHQLLNQNKPPNGARLFNKTLAKKALKNFFVFQHNTPNGTGSVLTDTELSERIIYLLGAFYKDLIEMLAYSADKEILSICQNYALFLGPHNKILMQYYEERKNFFSIMHDIHMKDKEKSREDLFQDAKKMMKNFQEILLRGKKLCGALELFQRLNPSPSFDHSGLDEMPLISSKNEINEKFIKIKKFQEIIEKTSIKINKIEELSR